MIGVMFVTQALEMARDVGLDLIEISPNVEPPVCKILDHGKFKYEEQKKQAAARKKQKIIEVKEIQLSSGIGENDYQVKLRAMHRFLEEGNKVKITIRLRFRGREVAHIELPMQLMDRVKEDLKEIGKVEHSPKKEGKQMLMILAPLK
jgi:translation initiation factor IF-3